VYIDSQYNDEFHTTASVGIEGISLTYGTIQDEFTEDYTATVGWGAFILGATVPILIPCITSYFGSPISAY